MLILMDNCAYVHILLSQCRLLRHKSQSFLRTLGMYELRFLMLLPEPSPGGYQ